MKRTATIIVPTRMRDGSLVPARDIVAYAVLRDMARMFGGATAVEGQDAWVSADGSVIDERVTLITSYADDATAEEKWPGVRTLVAALCHDLRQEAVAIILDGNMELVTT